MKKVILLASGGIDSSTILSQLASEQNIEIYLLSFLYQQNHKIEIEKIKEYSKKYTDKIKEHKIVQIDLSLFGGSSLTDQNIDVPKYNQASDLGDEIPTTYVPSRNTIFLSYALAYTQVINSNDIYIGVHATDYANYPDCRPEFIKSFEEMANISVKGVMKDKIIIHTPLINMSKKDIVKLAIDNNVDFSKTISCYDPSSDGLSCGKCHACLVRLDAINANNIIDSAKYM